MLLTRLATAYRGFPDTNKSCFGGRPDTQSESADDTELWTCLSQRLAARLGGGPAELCYRLAPSQI